jgi:mannitol-1-phosphate/altronate dehydrogenase
MVSDPLHFGSGNFGRADIEKFVELARIGIEYFATGDGFG